MGTSRENKEGILEEGEMRFPPPHLSSLKPNNVRLKLKAPD